MNWFVIQENIMPPEEEPWWINVGQTRYNTAEEAKAYFEQLPEEERKRCRVAEAYTVTVSQTKYRDIRKPRR